MICDGFDLVLQNVSAAVDRFAPGLPLQAKVVEMHCEAAQQQMLGIEMKQQAFEPIEQQVFQLIGRQNDLDALERLNGIQTLYNDREQCFSGVLEEGVQIRSRDPQTQIGGVV